MIKQIALSGDDYEVGWQHGRQVYDLRPRILKAVTRRLTTLAQLEDDLKPLRQELKTAWEETAGPLLAMLHGIADALDLEWEDFFRYTVATYLLDRAQYPAADSQGCTVWAANQTVTHQRTPILTKNRDYWPDHRALQCIARCIPKAGYRYVYLTSAGSPGVFSSGMNEAGLAVADTHVVSLDIGPGLPRYAVMMEILEHHDRVESALDYVKGVRHSGNGTLVLADRYDDVLVVETGYKELGLVAPADGFVISTNHFVSPELRDQWLERGPEGMHGNSQQRYKRVREALQMARGAVDLDWVIKLMSSHGDGEDSICRHPGAGPRSVTISSVLFRPQERQLYLTNDMPCQSSFQAFSANFDVH